MLKNWFFSDFAPSFRVTLAAEKKTNTDDDADDDDDADARHLATFLRFKRVSLFLKDEPGMKINFERLNLSFRRIGVIIDVVVANVAFVADVDVVVIDSWSFENFFSQNIF